MALDRDAAGCRRESGPGEMPEDRAAAPANHRCVVPTELDDDVVEMVRPLQSLLGLDLSAALTAHYPDTYIAWMQAGAADQPASA